MGSSHTKGIIKVTKTDRTVSRRGALTKGLAGAGAVSLIGAAQAQEPKPVRTPYDLQNPVDNLEVYVKLRGRVDGQETYSWTAGEAYGSRPGKIAEPLFDIQTCLRSKWVSDGNDGYTFHYRGMIIFFEPGTTRPLETWLNPLNGLTVTPVHYHTSLAELSFTPGGIKGGVLALAEPSSGMIKDKFIQPTHVVGDDLWMLGDERMIYSRPSDGAVRVDNLINRYHGRISELEDRSRPGAHCNSTWTAELNWFPWMKLDDVPGHLFWGGMGRKYFQQDELPQKFIDAADSLWPGAFTEPLGA